jgi:hypothetical protein
MRIQMGLLKSPSIKGALTGDAGSKKQSSRANLLNPQKLRDKPLTTGNKRLAEQVPRFLESITRTNTGCGERRFPSTERSVSTAKF